MNINYRQSAIREIQNFANQFPEYTLGEILYSFLRGKDIKNLSDQEVYSAVEKAIEYERE